MTGGDESTPTDWIVRLREWRQGDAVICPGTFIYAREDPCSPIPRDEGQALEDIAARDTVLGFVVVSQTCDIVNAPEQRPFLEVVPLIDVPRSSVALARKGRSLQHLYLPRLADRCLVGDLSRVMTVTKRVVAIWTRTACTETDRQSRSVAQALARKRQRFAFPGDFVEYFKPLRKHLVGGHKHKSEAGQVLDQLEEIRVRAAPDWNASEVKLTFLFVEDRTNSPPQDTGVYAQSEAWRSLLPAGTRFEIEGWNWCHPDDIRASDIYDSDRLDLDEISLSDPPK